LRTCCRNRTSFANWQHSGLSAGWHSEKYQTFRQQIVAGEFPDTSCRNCWHNGTARSLESELSGPFRLYTQRLQAQVDEAVWNELHCIERLFGLSQADEQTATDVQRFTSCLAKLHFTHPELAQAQAKLTVIGQVAEAFLTGNLTPPVVAPFRQVQLIAKCNARCIQCPGLFSGEIMRGPALEERYIDAAFARPDDIFDFFMNGSEFLVFKGWKKVARLLAEHGVAFSISTNSILLTPPTIRFLIDERIVRSLNVSIDGATPNTIEAVRVNVRYEELIAHLRYLFAYTSQQQYALNLSISFVLMKCNYAEFPELVRLIDQVRGSHPLPQVHVYCQALENYTQPENYVDFVQHEHHSQVPQAELVRVFAETLRASQETGIPVNCFYTHKLEDFIAAGCPFPPLSLTQDAQIRSVEPLSSAPGQEAVFALEVELPASSHLSSIAYQFHLCVPKTASQVVLQVRAKLQLPVELDHAKPTYLYAVLGMSGGDERIWCAHTQEQQPLAWQVHKGSLQSVVSRNGIACWRALKPEEAMSWDLGTHRYPVLSYHPPLDVYFGYAAYPHLTAQQVDEFHGAAFRIVWNWV